jgi:hypothetical protein
MLIWQPLKLGDRPPGSANREIGDERKKGADEMSNDKAAKQLDSDPAFEKDSET